MSPNAILSFCTLLVLCLVVGMALLFTATPTFIVALLFTTAHVLAIYLLKVEILSSEALIYLGIAFLTSLYAVITARFLHTEAGLPIRNRTR